MKALVVHKYGSVDNLQFSEVDKPIPEDHEVLVKVKATSVNFNNLIIVTGKPFIGRIFSGLFSPNGKIPGNDVAGQVEAVGENVKKFKIGDEVFGDIIEYGGSTFAEYVCVPEEGLLLKPENLSFEESAVVPEAGLVALQALMDHGNLKPGEKVLIYGASGGIGTFAVQLAKVYGAEVTGVCSGKNADLVRSIGADHTIDYTRKDFLDYGPSFDLIIATVGYRPIRDYKKALKPAGRYIATGGTMKQIIEANVYGSKSSKGEQRKLAGMSVIPNKDLSQLKSLIEAGKVRPVIDTSYPFDSISDALKHYGTGHSRGKIAIYM